MLLGWTLPLCALAVGCGTGRGGWSYSDLVRREPALSATLGRRLSDATPYAAPVRDAGFHGLELFLCRWPDSATVSVSLPADARAREREIFRMVLRAWQGAGLGIRFREVPGEAQIELRFADPSDSTTARTAADCALSPTRRLVRARVSLRRERSDALGRPLSLSDEELAGAALHELGHALGFQGHVAWGESVMGAAVATVRRLGGRTLGGAPFEDSALSALYSVPSGAPVGRVPLSVTQVRVFDRLQSLAADRAWPGPFARIGDRSAQLHWWNGSGEEVALVIVDWRDARRHPERLHFFPNIPALHALYGRSGRGGDLTSRVKN